MVLALEFCVADVGEAVFAVVFWGGFPMLGHGCVCGRWVDGMFKGGRGGGRRVDIRRWDRLNVECA